MYMHAHMSVDTHECICMWKSKTDIRVFLNHFLPYSLGQGLSMNPELVSTGYLACFKDVSTGSPSPSEPCNSRRITIPVQCLHEFWGSEFWSSGSHSKYFTDRDISPALTAYILHVFFSGYGNSSICELGSSMTLTPNNPLTRIFTTVTNIVEWPWSPPFSLPPCWKEYKFTHPSVPCYRFSRIM